MASSTHDGESHDAEIRLWQEADWWLATDVNTGVRTEEASSAAALESRDDASRWPVDELK